MRRLRSKMGTHCTWEHVHCFLLWRLTVWGDYWGTHIHEGINSKGTETALNPTQRKSVFTYWLTFCKGLFYIFFLQKCEIILCIPFLTCIFPFNILEHAFPHVVTNFWNNKYYPIKYLPKCYLCEHYPMLKLWIISIFHYYKSCNSIIHNSKKKENDLQAQ